MRREIAQGFADRSRPHAPFVIGLLSSLAVLTGHLPSASALAADSGPLRLFDVTVGIRGQYQVGRWTAIEGTVESASWPVNVAIRVPDPDGNLTRYPLAPIEKPSSSSQARFRGLFQTGRLDGVIRVELQTDDVERRVTLRAGDPSEVEQISAFNAPWTQQTQLWATLGDPAGFSRAVERITGRVAGLRPPVQLIKLSQSSELPTELDALQSLDLLVINGPQDVAPDVNDAIRRWVVGGGHLIVSMGNVDEFAASPLAQWLPLRVSGQSRLRDLSHLTTQVPGSAALRVGVVEAIRFDMDEGETIASTLDGPLWVRLPCGFGRVSFLGIDLSRRPLVDWESLPLLCERLADSRRRRLESRQRTATAQLSQTGVSDLQTQLAAGLDQFSEVRQPTNWMVMGCILLFLIVIGPVDYLIVHKLLGRPHWTWVTFPLLVIAAVGAATAAARQRYPTVPLANQVDLVDVDTASRSVRVRSWMSFTSPTSDRHRIDAELADSAKAIVGPDAGSLRISWTGIPETGFRGMYRTGGLDLAKPEYSFAPQLDAILDLPVTQWSSASTSAAWTGVAEAADSIVTAQLQASAGQLTGTFTNRLRVPLQDWFLAHEGRVYLPETRRGGADALKIPPGEIIDLSDRRRIVPRVLKHFLTGLRTRHVARQDRVGGNFEAERDVYDPLDRDPFAVLRIISFYKACDGNEFTSLSNRSLDQFDLSPLLPLDRAILFCRLEEPAATFSINDKPLKTTEHATILRIALPVHSP